MYGGLLLAWLFALLQNTQKMLSGTAFFSHTHSFPLAFQDFMRFYSIGQIVLFA